MGNAESVLEEFDDRAAESFILVDTLAKEAADGFVDAGFEVTAFSETFEISGDGVEITGETVAVLGDAIKVTTDFATGVETTTVVEFEYFVSSI